MTKEEAARILDLGTREQALLEYDSYERLNKLEEACWIAVEELRSKPTGEALTLEQLRGMKKVTPVWWEGAGFWCLAQSGGIVTPFGQCYDVKGLPGEFYSYPPTHIDREAFCGSWEGEADGYANGELVYDVWRCSGCGHVEETDDPDLLPDFCPDCGLAMTEKAWAILEKRLRG